MQFRKLITIDGIDKCLFFLSMQEEIGKLQQSVIDQLHLHIDPFDLEVFSPYILSALERQLQRSTVCYTISL